MSNYIVPLSLYRTEQYLYSVLYDRTVGPVNIVHAIDLLSITAPYYSYTVVWMPIHHAMTLHYHYYGIGCLFVGEPQREHTFSQRRSMHVDTHDLWCVATEIDRSDCLDMAFGAMQR